MELAKKRSEVINRINRIRVSEKKSEVINRINGIGVSKKKIRSDQRDQRDRS